MRSIENWTRFGAAASPGVACGSAMEDPSGSNVRFYYAVPSNAAARRPRLRRLAVEQLRELPRPLERGEVVVAADVMVADVDLRHRAAPGALHHLLAPRGIGVDADLRDVPDALGGEEPLRLDAVRADGRGVHRDRRLGRGAHCTFSTGRPASDRKSTRLNSSHGYISYAVFC